MSAAVASPVTMGLGHLMLDTVPTPLAIATSEVMSVERFLESAAEPPRALNEILSIGFAAPEPRWVLTLGSPSDSSPVLVQGPLRIQHILGAALIAMPSQYAHGFELFTHVVTADDMPSALVLNVAALRRALRE